MFQRDKEHMNCLKYCFVVSKVMIGWILFFRIMAKIENQ